MTDDFWREKRVLVTGCSGLLGSWMAAELSARGSRVLGLTHSKATVPSRQTPLPDYPAALDQIELVRGDIRDSVLMQQLINGHQIEVIFHLAAQTLVGVANRSPVDTFDINIKGTWTLLEAARQSGRLPRIVVASSDKAYGTQKELPYREEAPLRGLHPYDVSKSCADLISRTYANTYDLPLAVTRCANLYGGGDLNWNRIVPGTMRSVLRAERPVIRSDGTLKRNYIFVRDAVRGSLMLAEQLHRPEVHGHAFNFGVIKSLSALHMINSIISQSDHPQLEPIILNEAKNEIKEQHLSSQKALRVLGWEPQYSLERGLAETLSWYRAYLTPARA